MSEKRWERNKRKRGERRRKKKRGRECSLARDTLAGGKFFSPESLSLFLYQPLCIEERVSLSLYFFTNHVGKEDTLDGTLSFGLISLLSLSLSFIHIFCFSLFQGPHIELWQGTHIYTHTYAPIVPPRRNPFKTNDAAHETVYETISLSLASPFSPDSMDWTDRSIYTQSIPRRVFLSFLFFFRGKITDRWTRDLKGYREEE